ncbi:MAG: hypothetical protein OXH05_12630 [Acidobacteria bacterium]|nr:hypothetical protein [Acidobacteriota bacterium]
MPANVARALDLTGIFGGPEFIGVGLGALRRVRRVAAILRGDLLTPEDTLDQPTEHEPTGDAPDR